jgi:hypothetical protein
VGTVGVSVGVSVVGTAAAGVAVVGTAVGVEVVGDVLMGRGSG